MKHASKPTPKAPIQIKPAEAKPKTEKPAYLRELTDIQLRACELASDLIMNGGAHDDVSGLLYNLIAHEWRRRFPDWHDGPAKADKLATDHAENFWPKWYAKLAKHWPEATKLPERPEPTTVIEMVRENARRRLENVFFDDFMGDASPEDVYFLREVLENAFNSGWSLPESFAYETTMDHTYIKVPYKRVKLVEKYIALLEEGEDNKNEAACA